MLKDSIYSAFVPPGAPGYGPRVIFKPPPYEPRSAGRRSSVGSIMSMIAHLNKMRQQRKQEEDRVRQKQDILEAMQTPSTPEQKRAAVLEAVRSTAGGESRLGGMVTQAELDRIMQDPYEQARREQALAIGAQRLDPENLARETRYKEAQIKSTEALADARETGGSQEESKPISTADDKTMDSYISTAKKRAWGPNYTQENLLKAWEGAKMDMGWDNRENSEQKQLWQRWNRKTMGSDYQWDPESEEVRAAGPALQAPAAVVPGQAREPEEVTSGGTGQTMPDNYLMPFDVAELSKNLDEDDKQKLIAIIKSGDSDRMREAYRRLQEQYGNVR